MALILVLAVFINTEWGQNTLVNAVTNRLSKDLKTKMQITHVSFSLFNKMNLEGVLVEDRQQDTLLYAGNMKVNITDWFFLKDKIVLKYIGLQEAKINLHRADSVWNYQFLVDYFSGGSSAATKEEKKGIELDFKKIELRNLAISQKDEWQGQDLGVQLSYLFLDADEINLASKKIEINSLRLTDPLFHLKNYTGLKPKVIKAILEDEEEPGKNSVDSLLKWNAAGWLVHIDKMQIGNGRFILEKQISDTLDPYFDARKIDFASINGTFNNTRFEKDTLLTSLQLSTKERSGFELKSMQADAKLTPQEMAFDKLEIKTNNSIIRDYFRMSYDDMSDLGGFISKVNMQARFTNAEIDTDDIAFFAPDLKTWKKKIKVNGNARGTVEDMFADKMTIEAGKNTYLHGNISLIGLPDINKTFIDFNADKFRTTYTDAATFYPAIRKITTPRLQNISYLDFSGSFTGFIRDFVTFGTIRTNLGTVVSDVNMKIPSGKNPFYSGNIATENFNLGRFMSDSTIGLLSIGGQVKGQGFTWNTLAVDMDADIRRIDYNNYTYQNITTTGSLRNKIFNGNFSIQDSNATLTLNGIVDLSSDVPRFNFISDVSKINLLPLHLANDSISFRGKLDFDFSSSNVDNFLGTAKIRDAVLSRKQHTWQIDSFTADARYIDGVKRLLVNSKELNAEINGDFNLQELPNSFRLVLNKYYPSYIKAPSELNRDQVFNFKINIDYTDELLKIFSDDIAGFNGSELSGQLNTKENRVDLKADIPSFIYNGYEFDNVKVNGVGTSEKLSLTTTVDHLKINDSISFPSVKVNLSAKDDSTVFGLTTESSNRITPGGSLQALVRTFEDGVAIRFEPSSFSINGKTWTIEKDGELELRSKAVAYSEILLRESFQEIKISTRPSDIGHWNDLKIDLKNINIGDITSLLVKSNRFEGSLSGNITIEDPVNTFNISSDIITKDLWVDNDSIGQLQTHVFYNNKLGKLTINGKKMNPDEKLNYDLKLFLKDLATNEEDEIDLVFENHPVKIAERFVKDLFSDFHGYATGQLKIKGKGENATYTGKAKLRDAGLRVKFTQCFYKINDAEINFREDAFDLGKIKFTDTVTNNTATLSRGIIRHKAWNDLVFDIRAEVDRRPMLLLNTTKNDNTTFYGKAFGTGSFALTGPMSDMKIKIVGEASTSDSSQISIVNTTSRESGMADFLVERKYGRELSDSSYLQAESNLTYDIQLTSNPRVKVRIVLDELTNDEIQGRGEGNIRIVSGTAEPMTMTGRYNILDGNYLFTFQSFFKKPFELKKDADNFIQWTGDPYHPETKITAVYKTDKKVDFSPLLNASAGTSGNVTAFRDYVYVIAILSGDLFKPDIKFSLDFPPDSPPKKNFTASLFVKELEENENELNKQVAFLVVFNSFAPTSSVSVSSVGVSSGAGIALNSISAFLSNEVNKELNKLLSDKLKLPGLYVNFSGSFYDPKPFEQDNTSGFGYGANLNLAVGKTLFNNRVIMTFEGNYDIPMQNTGSTTTTYSADLLNNFTTEFLINKSGTVRATIFYKENFDYYAYTPTAGNSKVKKYGTSLSYRREFNKIGEFFRREKKTQINTPKVREPENE